MTELEGRRSLRSAALLRPLGAALARAKPDLVQGWMYHGNVAAFAGGARAAPTARPCSGASGRPWSGSATTGR